MGWLLAIGVPLVGFLLIPKDERSALGAVVTVIFTFAAFIALLAFPFAVVAIYHAGN